MTSENPTQWTEVKKVKFHHRVKNFYYKNLFRKIYTIAIIGLIGANVFSLLKYQTFAEGGIQYTPVDSSGYGTIIIPNPSNPSEGFTILDRNLGATATGAGSSASSDSYGYYYQWGNNNGNPGNSATTGTLLIWEEDGRYNKHGYDGENNEFIANANSIADIWSDDTLHNDLWGGGNDIQGNNWGLDLNNPTDRRGPCPENYHVPSVGEWGKIMEYRCGNNPEKCPGTNLPSALGPSLNGPYLGKDFVEDLNIPYAGFRAPNGIAGQGGAHLWSSSSDGNVYPLYIDDHQSQMHNQYPRLLGLPIRCVNDSYQLSTEPQTLTSYATLLAGKDFNVKIKKLAGQSEAKDYTTNTSITSIKRATQLEEGLTDDNIISTGDSEYVIYAWFDSSDGTIYYHTDANKVQMNADSSFMFQSLQGLSGELDISSWDTSNVTNMGGMFYGVTINSGLDLSSWDTSNVNDMNYMFAGVTINSDFGLSSWDTSSVTNMRNMFCGVTINTGLGLSNWDISNVTNMSYMFNSATINTELGLSNWDMSNVTNMTAMFGNSTINSGLDLSNWIINSRVNSPSMFIQATINSELDLSNWVINSGAKLVLMFQDAKINSGLDLSNWVIGSGADVHDMFQGLTINSELDLSNWVIGSGADVWWMFDVATINSGLDLSNWVINSGVNSNAMFSYATINSELDLSNWVISSETNMNSMFYGTKVNSELDLSNWIISGANMTAMFGELQINTKLDLSSWDISNEPNMTAMFYQAQIKSGLDLSNWDTSSVTNMNSMFYGAQIPTIYVTSGFDTSNVTSSDKLFTNSTVVGGNGTVCNTALDTSYLRIDRPGEPGCFTEKVCEEGYRIEGGQCVSNTKTVPCTQSGKPDNSSYNVQDVEVLYDTGTDTWSIAENCSWTCDNGYTENNGKCEQIKSHGGSSGRGRSSSINKKHDSASDETSNTSDENPEESNENLNESVKDAEGSVKDSKESDNEITSKGQNIAALNTEKYDINYSTEQNQAYQFARGNKITTTSTIREAKMNSPLTRIEMAKMLSYYAMNVLKQTPDISKSIKFSDISDKLDAKYDNGVTLAYQLGIMGINMPNNKFRPNDKVTRAEFATALSRMLYGIEDGKGKIKYYEPHMAKLYNEGIINKVDPKMLELRGYVMIMLMRTAK